MRIARQHHRDRLADKAYFFHRQDGLIVERRPVIGIGDDLDDVFRGDHAEDSGNFLRRAGVYRFDAAMSDRRAEDFAMQHARKAHEMGVFGASGDFFTRFEPRHGTADLAAAYRIGRHKRRPP
jgi:hypothetical protein